HLRVPDGWQRDCSSSCTGSPDASRNSCTEDRSPMRSRSRAVVITLLAFWPARGSPQIGGAEPALAEREGGGRGVGVITTLSGSATVARAALPAPQPLRFKDDVFLRDRISTAEKSIVRVLLGGKALVTVRELRGLTITYEHAPAPVGS